MAVGSRRRADVAGVGHACIVARAGGFVRGERRKSDGGPHPDDRWPCYDWCPWTPSARARWSLWPPVHASPATVWSAWTPRSAPCTTVGLASREDAPTPTTGVPRGCGSAVSPAIVRARASRGIDRRGRLHHGRVDRTGRNDRVEWNRRHEPARLAVRRGRLLGGGELRRPRRRTVVRVCVRLLDGRPRVSRGPV